MDIVLDADRRKELREIFGIYKAYANHEDGLASHRFAWMMLLNSALFTVYVYCLAIVNSALPTVSSGDSPGAVETLLHSYLTWSVYLLFVISIFGACATYFFFDWIKKAKQSIDSLSDKWEPFCIEYNFHAAADDLMPPMPNLTNGFCEQRSYHQNLRIPLSLVFFTLWACTLAVDFYMYFQMFPERL